MIDDYDLTKLKTDKKKRTNSKAKGSRFERKIASLLNNRLNTKEFSRTPGSGAFATTHTLPDYLKIYGDLIAPSKFKYCIECKKGYKNIKINNILDYSSQLWKFIEQCEKDSLKCGKEPMLLMQQDRQPTLAFIKRNMDEEKIKNYAILGEYKMVLFDDLLEIWDDSDWFTP
jgi:Holliday junction resolvase